MTYGLRRRRRRTPSFKGTVRGESKQMLSRTFKIYYFSIIIDEENLEIKDLLMNLARK